jgi:hypothetical protein
VKAIRLLFALYILALSVYPCSDKATCSHEKKEGIAIVDPNHHDHKQAEQDICSPLCICSCCAASVQLTVNYINMPVGIEHATKFVIPYQEKALVNHASSIWQPPRIA